MCSRTFFAFSLFPLTLAACLPSQSAQVPPSRTKGSVISAAWVETRGRKPPLQTFFVRLSVTNRSDHAVWYITRYYGDRPLPSKDPFQADMPWKTDYIIANAYNGEQFGGKGKFRTIGFLGADRPVSHSFMAFLLPAGGHLQHDFFPIDSWSDITSLEVWEASALKVNGQTPLEDWLPFEVMTDKETHITRQASLTTTHQDAFQRKPGKAAGDFPEEEVKAIVPTVLTKRTLSINGISPNRHPK